MYKFTETFKDQLILLCMIHKEDIYRSENWGKNNGF